MKKFFLVLALGLSLSAYAGKTLDTTLKGGVEVHGAIRELTHFEMQKTDHGPQVTLTFTLYKDASAQADGLVMATQVMEWPHVPDFQTDPGEERKAYLASAPHFDLTDIINQSETYADSY